MLSIPDWIAGLVLVLVLLLFARFVWHQSFGYQYRDIIVSRWQDADFYLGNPNGSEFEYDPKNPNCTWSQVVRRDGWKCGLCDRKVWPMEKCYWLFVDAKKRGIRIPWRRMIHVDHKIAFILGGKGDKVDDGRVLCHVCNIRRSRKIDRICLDRVRELKKKIYIGSNVPKYESTRKKR